MTPLPQQDAALLSSGSCPFIQVHGWGGIESPPLPLLHQEAVLLYSGIPPL